MKMHLSNPKGHLKRLVCDLLLQALELEPGEIWLITPWLKDVEFDLEGEGVQRSILGTRASTIGLMGLFARLVKRHQVTLIIKPPHELVNLRTLGNLHESLELRERLREPNDFEDATLQAALFTERQKLIDEQHRTFLNHADTVLNAEHLATVGVQVAYCANLHAKLLWLPNGALFGSANFTNGGLTVNAELMAEVLDDASLQALRHSAQALLECSIIREQYLMTDPDCVPYYAQMPLATFNRYAHAPLVQEMEGLSPILEFFGNLYTS